MKNQNTNENRSKYGNLGFYLVLALCAVMIGVSCWFAYTQTANDLSMQLESALDPANERIAQMPESDLTTIPTEPETTAAPVVYVPSTMAEEMTTAAQEVSLMQTIRTETASETVTETVALEAVYPVEGEILQPFSNGELVKSPTTGVWQTHNGVDIAAALGDEVRAMSDGIVEAVSEDPLWGVCVTIDHQNGVKSRYCNLNAGLTVNTGDTVTSGMVIGAVGNTADMESALDAHLHFEIMQGNSYLDPEEFLK